MTSPVSSLCSRCKNVFWWDPPAAQNKNKISSRKKVKEREILADSSGSKAIKSNFNASSVLRCFLWYALRQESDLRPPQGNHWCLFIVAPTRSSMYLTNRVSKCSWNFCIVAVCLFWHMVARSKDIRDERWLVLMSPSMIASEKFLVITDGRARANWEDPLVMSL